MLRSLSWYASHIKDPYVKKATSEGYRARSAYKLLELNQRYKFLYEGLRVLELGAHPGGWTQVAVKAVGSTEKDPKVLGVDLSPIEPLSGAKFLPLDVKSKSAVEKILEADLVGYDVVLSDLAPNMTGDRDTDCAMMCEIGLHALKISKVCLKKGGTVLMKMFYGLDEPEHYVRIRQTVIRKKFEKLERVKPAASKSKSREFYYLGTGWNPEEEFFKSPNLEIFDEENWAENIEKVKGPISFTSEVPQTIEEIEKFLEKYKENPVEIIPENELFSSSDEELDTTLAAGSEELEDESFERDDLREFFKENIGDYSMETELTKDPAEDFRRNEKEYENFQRIKSTEDRKIFAKKYAKHQLNKWMEAMKDAEIWK